MNQEKEIKQAIVSYCQLLDTKGFVAANDGNISVLLESDSLVITPTKTRKGDVTESMLLTLDFEGTVTQGSKMPSSETFLHIACYQARSNIKAVIHAHPPYATALASTAHVEKIAEEILLPEILITTGVLGVVEYCTPGSSELASQTAEKIASHNGLLLKNHGVVTVGESLSEAFMRLESIEMYCKVLLLAEQLGMPRYLSSEEVASVLERYPS